MALDADGKGMGGSASGVTHTVILSSFSRRDAAKRLVDAAPVGAVVNIRPATRTLAQNDKMHAMLSDISRAKPMGRTLPPETWKCLFMDDLGYKPKWEPSLDGDGVVNTGYRSSRLTVSEMSDMIERMTAFAAEHDIPLSDEVGR